MGGTSQPHSVWMSLADRAKCEYYQALQDAETSYCTPDQEKSKPQDAAQTPEDYFRTQMQKELERRNSIAEINLKDEWKSDGMKNWINFQADKLAGYFSIGDHLSKERYWTDRADLTGAEWFNNQPLPKNATETRRRLASMGPAAQCLERRRLATGGPRTPPVLAALMAEIEEA